MVSINTNRVLGRVTITGNSSGIPVQSNPEPQQQSTTQQQNTFLESNKATVNTETLLANRGINIGEPKKINNNPDSKSTYDLDSDDEYNKLLKSGLLKEYDKIRHPTMGWFIVLKVEGRLCVCQDGLIFDVL